MRPHLLATRLASAPRPRTRRRPVIEPLEGRALLATFTVTLNGDNGGVNPAPGDNTGTLRQAIIDANNAAGADTINFNITGPSTISPLAPLPALTGPTTINGFTQAGATANTLATGDNAVYQIVLDGTGAGATTDGLTLSTGSDGSVIRGLVINNFKGAGIAIRGSNGDTIAGNFLGTTADGKTAAANGGDGVLITAGAGTSLNNTIGGLAPADRNLISGNTLNGIEINGGVVTGAGGSKATVVNNYIGTDAAGTGKVANGASGVRIIDSSGNIVGGTTATALNVISGNTGDGVFISGTLGPDNFTATGNIVEGNSIGTQVDGTTAQANGGNGVLVSGQGALDNTIGGSAAGASNTIRSNGAAGVAVPTATAGVSGPQGTAILGNSIDNNTGLGIDLGTTGITPNDNKDGDLGGNNLQNFPVLSSVTNTGGGTHIVGTLNSLPGQTFLIQVFASPTGSTQGATLLGQTTVTTDATSGNAAIDFTTTTAAAPTQVVTSTASLLVGGATNPTRTETSEFSAPLAVAAPPGTATDLSITKTDSPDPVQVGQNLTYTLTVTNNGPGNGTGVTVTDTLPANVTFVSATPSQGTASQSGGVVTANLGNLANGASATITIVVTPQTAAGGTSLTNTATVTGNETDSSTANNTATTTTSITAAPGTGADVSITKTDSPDPVQVGQNLTYTLTVKNNGPNNATGVVVTDKLPANVTFVSATPSQGTASKSNGTVTINLGNLANGATATITVVVKPTTAAQGTTLSNTATVTRNETDSNSSNDSATATTSAVMATPTPGGGGRFGFHMQNTFLALGFSQPMNVVSAESVSNYKLVSAGRDGIFGTKDDRTIAIRSASYNAANNTVLLSPTIRLPLNGKYRLTVFGSGKSGLVSAQGAKLDGNNDGTPGDDGVITFDRASLRGPASARFGFNPLAKTSASKFGTAKVKGKAVPHVHTKWARHGH